MRCLREETVIVRCAGPLKNTSITGKGGRMCKAVAEPSLPS